MRAVQNKHLWAETNIQDAKTPAWDFSLLKILRDLQQNPTNVKSEDNYTMMTIIQVQSY